MCSQHHRPVLILHNPGSIGRETQDACAQVIVDFIESVRELSDTEAQRREPGAGRPASLAVAVVTYTVFAVQGKCTRSSGSC